ncbi:hypothetical protein A2U01_0087177, partial [Trifolium medium]|nr:hypothetical protein [Trifolium medium]
GNDASTSVTRHTGVVSDNVAASTRANFESETWNFGVPDNEPPENVMPADASDTNTVVNSPPNGSMETEVVEVNDTTSEEKSVEE